MILQRRLVALMDVQQSETRSLLVMFLTLFVLSIADTLMETASYALFVDRFGAESLPIVSLAIGIGTTLLTFGYLRIVMTVDAIRLLLANLVVVLVVLVLLWLGLALNNSPWIVFILPVWKFVHTVLVLMSFWTIFELLYDVRQGKRLGGLIASGEWIAAIAAGLIVPQLVEGIGTVNLLLVAAFALVTGIGLSIYLVHRYVSVSEIAAAPVVPPPRGLPPQNVLRSRYVILIFLYSFLWIGSIFIVYNLYLLQASATVTNADELAIFVSQVNGFAGALVLLAQVVFTSRLLKRFGLWAGLLVLPAVITLLMVVQTISGSVGLPLTIALIMAAATDVSMTVFGSSLSASGRRIAIQVVPYGENARVSVVNDGIIEPLAVCASALVMLALTQAHIDSFVQFAPFFIVIGLVWLVVAVMLVRAYPNALRLALQRRHLNGDFTLDLTDNLSLVRTGLRDSHPEAAIYAFNVLQQSNPDSVPELLPELLKHESPEIRLHGLQRIEDTQTTENTILYQPVLADVQRLWQSDPDPEVREGALLAFAALDAEQAFDPLVAAMDEGDTELQQIAMVGLLKYGGLEGVLVAGRKLLGMLNHADAETRLRAIQVISAIGGKGFDGPLAELLHDPVPAVRRGALMAVGDMQHSRLWSQVIRALGSTDNYAAAASALVANGSAALPIIEAAFAEPKQTRAVQLRLMRVIGRIRDARSIPFLEAQLHHADADMRTLALNALRQLRYRAEQPQRITQLIHQEVETQARFVAALCEMLDEHITLLSSAIEQEMNDTAERILLLLSFVYDTPTVTQIRDTLRYGNPLQRAYALEQVETLIPHDLKIYVLPVLEHTPLDQKFRLLNALFPQPELSQEAHIQALIADAPTIWIRASAIYAAQQLHLTNTRSTIIATGNEPIPLLSETAQRAINRLNATEVEKQGEKPLMLSTIEKVIILKTVSIFASTSDAILAEVATLLEEVELSAGEQLFEKGDLGNSMYIVVSGKLRIHDGDFTIDYRDDRQVVGEMALLDPEPRIASVTAAEDTLLFRIDQEPFYDLMADRIEVVREIMRVITGTLRARIQDIAELRGRIQALEERQSP